MNFKFLDTRRKFMNLPSKVYKLFRKRATRFRIGQFSDVSTDARLRGDQPFRPEHAEGLLHGHVRNPVRIRDLLDGGKLIAYLVQPLINFFAQGVSNLKVSRLRPLQLLVHTDRVTDLASYKLG